DVSKATATDMTVAILREVGLPAPERRLSSYAHQLSGGMRQRVMIAMALVLDPEILIADEPTTALDVTVQAQILDKLLEAQSERDMSMLLITHDLAVVAAVADRMAVMYAGEIVEQAPVDELFEDPKHPYTQGLLRALPHASAKKEKLIPIPGLVPPPQMMPAGCHFAPRCPHALSRCWEEHPEFETIDGRSFRCFNPQSFVHS
ncbi:MAG TPA: ABC transporter ATP-binding protein, partial [Actinobacteria bacterium]|nr:ABC transporter ATP-binding protein [Actinomycetota bacterium]